MVLTADISFPTEEQTQCPPKKMSEESFEREWKKNLMGIIEELSDEQYQKMLECLDIPQCKKSIAKKAEMPRMIIEHLGTNGSILAIRDAMKQIPRRDEAVQKLLRPFVAKLKNKPQKKKNVMKRIHDSESDQSEEEAEPVAVVPLFSEKKRKCKSGSEEQKATAGHEQSEVVSNSDPMEGSSNEEQTQCPPKKEGQQPPWKISIHDLISSDQKQTKKATPAKVVQKSGLRNYKTEDKRTRFLFYLAVADETDCIKVVIYGKEQYEKYKENECYLFRDIIADKELRLFRVTRESTVAKTKTITIPEDIQMKAQTLIYPNAPVGSIADVKESLVRVSVEGVIKKILPLKRVTENKVRKKDFILRDGEDSILISLWGEHSQQLRGKSEGDIVRVSNVKPNRYHTTVTLNSTSYTRVVKVESAPVQNVSIEIIGVVKAGMRKTHLEANFREEVQTLVVASKHLAEAFGIKLDGSFEENLLEMTPLSANAEIKGSKIIAITAN